MKAFRLLKSTGMARKSYLTIYAAYLALIVLLPTNCRADLPFEYGGLNLKTDPNTFQNKYPSSFVVGTSVRLSKEDTHDQVYLIDKSFPDGKEQLRISFEKPVDQLSTQITSWKIGHHLRHPKCEVIKEKIVQQCGSKYQLRHWVEERLNHAIYTWETSLETISLDCYSLDGHGKLLAADLLIRGK